MILREIGSGSRVLVEDVLRRSGISCAPAFSFDTSEAVRAFAEAGFGAAFLPRDTVAESLAEGSLRAATFRDGRLTRRFRWILHAERPISPATRAFHASLPSAGSEASSSRAKPGAEAKDRH